MFLCFLPHLHINIRFSCLWCHQRVLCILVLDLPWSCFSRPFENKFAHSGIWLDYEGLVLVCVCVLKLVQGLSLSNFAFVQLPRYLNFTDNSFLHAVPNFCKQDFEVMFPF